MRAKSPRKLEEKESLFVCLAKEEIESIKKLVLMARVRIGGAEWENINK
jgi:hypothetical protein